MKTKLSLLIAVVTAVTCSAQTNEDQHYYAAFTNAIAQRDERVATIGAMKGIELGALIAARLIQENPEAYSGINATAIGDDAKLVAERTLKHEPFSEAIRGTRAAARMVTTNFVALITVGSISVTNRVTVNTNAVIKFVESGGYCEAKGFHQWHFPPRVTSSNDLSSYRECLICKKGETQQPGEWK